MKNTTLGGPLANDQLKQGHSEISDKLTIMLFNKDYLDNSKMDYMKSLSTSLSESERHDPFEKYKYGGFWPAVGNIFLGVGSWLQKDFWGAAALTTAWLLDRAFRVRGRPQSATRGDFAIRRVILKSGAVN